MFKRSILLMVFILPLYSQDFGKLQGLIANENPDQHTIQLDHVKEIQ